MARTKNQFLQNVRTTRAYSPEVIAEAQLKYGEIAVFQNADEPSLGIKVGETTYAQFKDSKAVTAEITSAKTELSKTISEHTTKIGELETKFDGYATTGALATAKTELTADYDGKFTAIKGEGYTSGTTLKSLSDAIDSLKGGSDTTVSDVAKRVTDIEGVLGKSDTEGLRKDVADLKTTVGDSTTGLVKDVADLKTTVGDSTTGLVKDVADLKIKDTGLNEKIDAVSGASSAYTDSQINAIKGGETTETIVSLKGKIENNSSAISGITNSTKLDSFKDVENEINSKISSVYRVKGSCTYEELLRKSGQDEGDVWNVTDAHENVPAGTNYVWVKGEGETTAKWDALGGTIDLSPYATTATTKELESRLDTAESNINTLTAATGILNTSITTIQGWKINGSAITSDTVLNGTNLKVDTTAGAKTLKEAIADAAQSGSNAYNAFTAWTDGTYTQNQTTINNKLSKIDAYTVNGTKISENPVLTGENVRVSTATTAQTLNNAIAEAKKAGTTAQTNLDTLKGTYSGTLDTLSDKVDTNEQHITTINGTLATASSRANSAIQKITIKANADAGVRISEPKGGDGEKTQELDFSAIVIDCGTF